MYKCKHFTIKELVSPKVLELIEEDLAWKLFDENLLKLADYIKERYSPDQPVVINDWSWGGNFTQSGLRTKDYEKYNKGSMHVWGKSLDMKFPKNPSLVGKIREDIREEGVLFPYVTEVEEEVSWLHVSTSDRYQHLLPEGGVVFYKP